MKTTVRTGLPEVEWANVFNQENEIFNDFIWRDDGGNMRIKITPRRPSDTEIKQAKRRHKVSKRLTLDHPADDDIAGWRSWLTWVEKQVPRKYRASISLRFASESDYDSHTLEVTCTWERPETDEEWTARKNDVAQRLKAWQGHVEQERLARNQKIATALGGVAI